ncbi:pyridoxal 5'-phosphate synthase subunit PdxT [Phycicoccus endophyticus]|nr:pyridoxal 5'-phosphate synthase subunit PdxT [Phycicoccus endophyticus]
MATVARGRGRSSERRLDRAGAQAGRGIWPTPRHAVESAGVTTTATIGVLAVQGDVREHLQALERGGARATTVRRRSELEAVDGLVVPGGESTTMDKLVRVFELQQPLRERIAAGLPVYGSCAGMIMLADRLADGAPGQQTLGGMDILVRRNAFGRQLDSFEEDLHIRELGGEPVRAVFIRAPWVEEAGPTVEVLARVEHGPATGRIVAARQRNLLVTSFHPEVTGDHRVHRLFADIVRESLRERS